jgi:hypothetical protein
MNPEIVIQKLRAIGYHIRTDGQDILLNAEHDPLDPELATILLTELQKCKADAVRMLKTGSSIISSNIFRPRAIGSVAWPAKVKDLLDWFMVSPIQEESFQLSTGIHVVNSELFYAALRRDIEVGPTGPRARSGALQDDIKELHAKSFTEFQK